MQDAWRTYLELAVGVTDETRRKVQTAAQKLAGSGGATAAQVQAFAEELISTGLSNREALTKIVRFEVDRALGAVGLATAEEVADLTARVRQLEGELRRSRAGRGAEVGPEETGAFLVGAAGAAAPSGVSKAAAKKAQPAAPVTKKAVAKKAVAKKAQPEKAVAKQPQPEKAVVKKAVAKKAVAKAQPGASSGAQQQAAGAPVKKMAKKTVRPAANRQAEQR